MNTPENFDPSDKQKSASDDFASILSPEGENRPSDDRLFRRPVEKKPADSPGKSAGEPEEEEFFHFPSPAPSPVTLPETPEQPEPDSESESPLNPKDKKQTSWKLWQKAAAGVLLLGMLTAAVVQLWPEGPELPDSSVYYVQEDTLFALSANEDPKSIGEYHSGYDGSGTQSTMQRSPDGKNWLWFNDDGFLCVKRENQDPIQLEDTSSWIPIFSDDSSVIYYPSINQDGVDTLYQYDLDTGDRREAGSLGGNASYLTGEDRLVMTQNDGLAVLDQNTLSEVWFIEGDIIPLSIFHNRVYYAEKLENSYRLCCREGNQTQTVLEGIIYSYQQENGMLYFLCSEGDEISLSQLVTMDISSDLAGFDVENIQIRSPERTLYSFDGSRVSKLRENLLIYPDEKTSGVMLAASVRYDKPEEVKKKLSLSTLLDDYPQSGSENLAQYVEENWPFTMEDWFIVTGDACYCLPEGLSVLPGQYKVSGDWICVYTQKEASSENGFWIGRLEKGEAVETNWIPAEEAMGFELTEEGTLYYWNEFHTGSLYKDGVKLDEEINLTGIQVTEDGTLYYLSDQTSEGWTLNRYIQEQPEELAQNVSDYTACTRDYVVYLQLREDGDWDLYSRTSDQLPTLVAEEVSMLIDALPLDKIPQSIKTGSVHLNSFEYDDYNIE